jgi:two-component system response regulator AtoC
MERLIQHHYHGNVRELENIVKRMIVLNDPWLTRVTLPRVRGNGNGHAPADGAVVGANGHGDPQAVSLKEIVKEAMLAAERRTITSILEQTRWNRVKAAKLLNISYRALLYKMKHIGLEPKRTPQGPRT